MCIIKTPKYGYILNMKVFFEFASEAWDIHYTYAVRRRHDGLSFLQDL